MKIDPYVLQECLNDAAPDFIKDSGEVNLLEVFNQALPVVAKSLENVAGVALR